MMGGIITRDEETSPLTRYLRYSQNRRVQRKGPRATGETRYPPSCLSKRSTNPRPRGEDRNNSIPCSNGSSQTFHDILEATEEWSESGKASKSSGEAYKLVRLESASKSRHFRDVGFLVIQSLTPREIPKTSLFLVCGWERISHVRPFIGKTLTADHMDFRLDPLR